MSAEINEVLDGFRRFDVRVQPEQIEQFADYLSLLERWNRAVSLTAIRERPTVVLRHFVEPAMALSLLDGAGPTLLDVGAGAGIPGVPFKILQPDKRLILVESNQRKADFLCELAETLALDDVHVIAGRFEAQLTSLGEDTDLGAVNVLTARAWSDWAGLLGVGPRLMHPGARAILFIGQEQLREVNRHLGSGAAVSSGPWNAASRAGWRTRRVLKLPHLRHGVVMSLELPA